MRLNKKNSQFLIIAAGALLLAIIAYLFLQNSQLQQKLTPPTPPDVVLLDKKQTKSPSREPNGSADETANWKTYTNTKYNFSLKYPKGWGYVEIPNEAYQTQNDEVWFSHSDYPPPQTQTGARADIAFVFTNSDPSLNWQSQYFNNYKAESYQLGNISAKKITGINKEGLNQELIIIAIIGNSYLQVFSNQEEKSLQDLDQILQTFRFTN